MNTLLAVCYVVLAVFQPILGCMNRPNRPPTPAPTPGSTPAQTPALSGSSCRCGVPQGSRNRIVGGKPAAKNEYPWQVALVQNGATRPFCGGTLLSSRTVLTAAHCNIGSVSSFKVHVGEHDVTRPDGEQKIQVSKFLEHPQYKRQNQDNDFAIITLSIDVTFSNSVMPVCLPDPSNNYNSRVSTVTGWGTFSSGSSSTPNTLYEVDVKTISNSACTTNTQYGSGDVTSNMICAKESGKDACQGDSGGPLITMEVNNYFSIIGVVSWGIGCAQPDAPGVYSRVTSKLPWIEGEVRGNTCPKPPFLGLG